jgi:ADP-dependent NAD(P)H-hydrate dehydratase / NAD(P)H-hydrate epimerase
MEFARAARIARPVVTTAQMQAIEARVFAAGMPVAALMEKVALRLSDRVTQLYPLSQFPRVGVLVGPGHNGGDALVVARELHWRGYQVRICCISDRLKELTSQHLAYAKSLGILISSQIEDLQTCDWLVDGLFGFGLTRALGGVMADLVQTVNHWPQPIVSIDLPSGIQTDTGAVLGAAIQAQHTICLGLWKRGVLQEQAIDYLGIVELLDFDLPFADIDAVLGLPPQVECITEPAALAYLPLARPLTTYKYKMGNLLLVCGSDRYAGAAILAGLGARASGVGMLSIAVPKSLKPMLTQQIPEALVISCPETATGAIQTLPEDLVLDNYSAIGCGCGLTTEPRSLIQQILASQRPVILDADGLTIAAQQPDWFNRSAPTVLTPHLGEFRRLFPHVPLDDRITAVQTAAAQVGAIVLLKGARVTIADPQGQVRINPQSTPALARGGSGDVLTGLVSGLSAQDSTAILAGVATAAWWHAQAGLWGVAHRTELGVDAQTLAQGLLPALHAKICQQKI